MEYGIVGHSIGVDDVIDTVGDMMTLLMKKDILSEDVTR